MWGGVLFFDLVLRMPWQRCFMCPLAVAGLGLRYFRINFFSQMRAPFEKPLADCFEQGRYFGIAERLMCKLTLFPRVCTECAKGARLTPLWNAVFGCGAQLLIGAALENFPLEEPRKSFWFHVSNQNRALQPCQSGFFPTPSIADFIKHHVRQNWPPWHLLLKDHTTSSLRWQCSCMGASLARATTLPKLQVCHPPRRKTTPRAHNNQRDYNPFLRPSAEDPLP